VGAGSPVGYDGSGPRECWEWPGQVGSRYNGTTRWIRGVLMKGEAVGLSDVWMSKAQGITNNP
jgi:hypothetical protein